MARIPEIVTPQRVVKQMVDMLPVEVWNDQTVFLIQHVRVESTLEKSMTG